MGSQKNFAEIRKEKNRSEKRETGSIPEKKCQINIVYPDRFR